ncbi:methyl-accepting chemotaxis protein [Heyndrickxia sporothermodurans]
MTIFTKKATTLNEDLNFGMTNIKQVDEREKARLSFLGITEETLKHVREAAVILTPYKKEIIEQFYYNITSVEHLQKIINHHSSLDRLKKTLEKYLEEFLKAEVDHNYIKTRTIVGKVHSRIHLTADHFISAHHMLIQMLVSLVIEHSHYKRKQLSEIILAIQKLGAFDQQLIVEIYMEDTFKTFLFDVSDLLNHTTQLNSTKQLIMGMEQQIEETHSVNLASEEIRASIQEVTNYAMKVSKGTEGAVQSAEQSKTIVSETLNDIQKVGNVYEQVIEEVSKLNQEIEQTKNVVKIIKGVAEQTNLLALNASIEAARAGEHGKGFAVVAQEVRKLSEHTKEQIIQITTNMESLQMVANQVTEQIHQTGELVDHSVHRAEYAGDALKDIVNAMEEINIDTSQIAAMNEEQTSTILDITKRNNKIYEHSMNTQEIANLTARHVFELSKRMEEYRNTFFGINVKLYSQDIIRVTITDHLLWKWKVYNMILGVETIDLNKIISHEECRLGKWYYSDLPASVRNSYTYKQLENPHKAVHHYAKQAIVSYKNNNVSGAQEAFIQLEEASKEVIGLLSNLEKELSKSN